MTAHAIALLSLELDSLTGAAQLERAAELCRIIAESLPAGQRTYLERCADCLGAEARLFTEAA